MASVLLRGGTVISMRDGTRAERADVLVAGTRISAVGAVEPPANAETLDCTDCYVLPGIVQIHLHLVQTLFRGLAEDLALLDWLRLRVWPLEAAHDEASIRTSVQLGVHELLTSGTTTILDMGTTHGGDFVAEELIRSGIRARFGQAMMDAGEGVPPRLLETTRASLDASAALKKRWDNQGGGRIKYAYAPRFALTSSRELLESVATLARMTTTLVHTHSNEDARERELVQHATGRAPIAYLADTGIASQRAILAHAVHVDDDEVRVLAETGAKIAHCPSSNLKLAAGIADVQRLRAARVPVGIGADGAACNNRLDGFEEMRMAALVSRVGGRVGVLTATDVLTLGTREGARALGMEDEIGSIEAGKRADLVIVDARRLAPGGDPATRIVFGGGSRAVRDVLVDGELLVRDGRPTRYDAVEVVARGAEQQRALISRAALS